MEKSNVPDFETATGTIDYGFTNEYNWPDRSISYASRNFDQLKRGEYYIDAKPVHSIGFLNFTLFEDNPEFNALYQLLNIKTKRLYSEKFSIHVIDLSRIDLATEEDRHYGIDRWAKLFKTKTWEDLRMITKNNETMQKAADSLYQLNSDAVARQCAQSRADAAYWETIKNNKLRYLEEANSQLTQTIDQQASQINQQASRIAELEAALAKQNK